MNLFKSEAPDPGLRRDDEPSRPSFRRRPESRAPAFAFALLALSVATVPAHAHGDAPMKSHAAAAPAEREQKPWGIAGEPRKVDRTIEIRMSDDMRFRPGRIEVREGETVRFVVRNRGRVLHEMVIGTPDELAAHAALMKKHPGMEHDEPYMAHVGAGGRGNLVWNFNRPGEFQFACLIPGHFEAGMTGTIVVRPAGRQGKTS